MEAKDGIHFKLYKMAENHYRVTFRCISFTDPLAMNIRLKEDFPTSPPEIRFDRKYKHSLLDDNGVVTNLDDLKKWNKNSDLGVIVQHLTKAFNQTQPTVKSLYGDLSSKPKPNIPKISSYKSATSILSSSSNYGKSYQNINRSASDVQSRNLELIKENEMLKIKIKKLEQVK